MTDYRNRLIVFGVAAALVLGGFAFGRWTSTEKALAFNAGSPATTTSPAPALASGSEAQSFYLSDYKTGYSEGYQSGTTGQGTGLAASTREGYNEGFKKGFADGFQVRNTGNVSMVPNQYSNQFSSTTARPVATRVSYRTIERERPVFVERRRGSKLKTILTIAAPAAIGAGVGAAFGGGRGAGAGALIGGGGGALWHLLRNKN
jgi:hypothetical protein